MKILRNLVAGFGGSAIWPAYLGLAAYMARQSPLPRNLAILLGATLGLLALAWFAANLVRWLLREGGPAETFLGVPPAVTKQLRWAGLTLIGGHVILLVPCWLLGQGLVSAGGRSVLTPTLVRLLILTFEAAVFFVAFRLIRSRSAFVCWAADSPEKCWGLIRWRRPLKMAILSGIAGVIALDLRGYSFSSRRLSNGAAGSLIVGVVCVLLYQVLSHAIGRHAWRWVKLGTRLPDGTTDAPDDLAARLRMLSVYAVGLFGLFLGAWVWDVDLALFRFISEQNLWTVDRAKELYVTVGDLVKAVVILTLCGLAWRHMSTFFAIAIFPRMQDDPGIRFAVVTLCRYSVLGLGLLAGLSSIHLGLEKIGVGLAALGVGLGFGLQEIVSNFVCGIILLLERPIRVGDLVTVSNMTGKIDRINIRATTITNGDNQSLIVPNRAFITGDLINWTLKDKVIRLSIKVRVALGTDPDQVSELLTAIARDDADVLHNPMPSAYVEEFGDSSMLFTLHAHVPEPSLGGRVKHRLIGQIQRRFQEEGILIALPTQELFLKSLDPSSAAAIPRTADDLRFDPLSPTPPVPKLATALHAPTPLEDCHRGVDE